MSDDKGKDDKKAKGRKQAALGLFFQPVPKKQKDGTLKQTIVPFFPTGNKNIHQDSMKIPCKAAPMCIQTFKNKQGLGSHLNSCPYYQEKLFKEKTSVCPVILIDKKVDASKDIRIATQKSTIANEIDQQKTL